MQREKIKELVLVMLVCLPLLGIGLYVLLNPEKPTSAVPNNSILQETNVAQEKAQEIVDGIITNDMSDFEKAIIIHDWLTFNVDYNHRAFLEDSIPDEDHTALGLFENRIAVCDGYSEAFRLMCKCAGLEAIEVRGNCSGRRHAWNQVKIDGVWYNVDVTWDDPTTDVNKSIDDNSNVYYAYFLISDEMIERDHVAESETNICPQVYDRKTVLEYAVNSGLYGNNVIVAETIEECAYKISLLEGTKNITIWYYDSSINTESDAQPVIENIIRNSGYLSQNRYFYYYTCVNGFLKMAVTIE